MTPPPLKKSKFKKNKQNQLFIEKKNVVCNAYITVRPLVYSISLVANSI